MQSYKIADYSTKFKDLDMSFRKLYNRKMKHK